MRWSVLVVCACVSACGSLVSLDAVDPVDGGAATTSKGTSSSGTTGKTSSSSSGAAAPSPTTTASSSSGSTSGAPDGGSSSGAGPVDGGEVIPDPCSATAPCPQSDGDHDSCNNKGKCVDECSTDKIPSAPCGFFGEPDCCLGFVCKKVGMGRFAQSFCVRE